MAGTRQRAKAEDTFERWLSAGGDGKSWGAFTMWAKVAGEDIPSKRLFRDWSAKQKPPCTVCDNTGWVCEEHMKHPSAVVSGREDACDDGPGVPCPECSELAA